MGQVPCGAKQGYGSDTLASALRVCTSAGKVTTESDSVETGCTTTYTAGLGEGWRHQRPMWERLEHVKAERLYPRPQTRFLA